MAQESTEEWAAFLFAYEASLEEDGWDATPVLMARMPDEGDEMVFDILGEGDPYEIIEGSDTTGASALVISLEGWAWPTDLPESERTGRPSEHPDRVELRSVLAVTGTGESFTLTRERGGEPIIEHDCHGPLAEAMEAALRASAE